MDFVILLQGAVRHLESAQIDGCPVAVLDHPFQGRREYHYLLAARQRLNAINQFDTLDVVHHRVETVKCVFPLKLAVHWGTCLI